MHYRKESVVISMQLTETDLQSVRYALSRRGRHSYKIHREESAYKTICQLLRLRKAAELLAPMLLNRQYGLHLRGGCLKIRAVRLY